MHPMLSEQNEIKKEKLSIFISIIPEKSSVYCFRSWVVFFSLSTYICGIHFFPELIYHYRINQFIKILILPFSFSRMGAFFHHQVPKHPHNPFAGESGLGNGKTCKLRYMGWPSGNFYPHLVNFNGVIFGCLGWFG